MGTCNKNAAHVIVQHCIMNLTGRVVRADEGVGLENRLAGNRHLGSNPRPCVIEYGKGCRHVLLQVAACRYKPERTMLMDEGTAGLQNLLADMSAGFWDAADFINRIWVDWKIGPVMAVLSMVMVFTRDYGLIRDFVKSDSKLKKWPKLAFYTAARVCMSVAAYHGPVWVMEWIIWFFEMIWAMMVHLYHVLSDVDQAFVMHSTTAVILIAFVLATAWAIREWFLKRFHGRHEKQEEVPVVSQKSQEECKDMTDWEAGAVYRKKAWRKLRLGQRVRILLDDGKRFISGFRKSDTEFPDVDAWRQTRKDIQLLPEDDEIDTDEEALSVSPKPELGAGTRIPARTGKRR